MRDDLAEIIQFAYAGAVVGPFAPPANVTLTGDQITYWGLAEPRPSIEELEAVGNSAEYWASVAGPLRSAAEAAVNAWANEAVMQLKILEPELFYVAMIANIALRLLEWNTLGKPEEVDPARFLVTIAEAQAYAETSAPGMTPADLLRLQEQKWGQMQQGFAAIVYQRRLALEQIKLAEPGENLGAELEAIIEQMKAGIAGQI